MATGIFDDLLAANARYSDTFPHHGLSGRAARGLAVLTCVDSRIDPLAMLGLQAGDAKILRNAGARATDDAIRSLVIVAHFLGVHRIMVVAHTNCAMSDQTDGEMRTRIRATSGVDATGFSPRTSHRQQEVLHRDVERIRRAAFMPSEVSVAGFVYDVDTGIVRQTA